MNSFESEIVAYYIFHIVLYLVYYSMGPDDFMNNYASYSPFVNRVYYSMSYTWFIIPWDPIILF